MAQRKAERDMATHIPTKDILGNSIQSVPFGQLPVNTTTQTPAFFTNTGLTTKTSNSYAINDLINLNN